ncbi:MAG: metalloregulator ArsR/SmtB family transcription factor [Thermodesulfobacteriota bacterium]|nr:MAG: metalloregulator ArsR/SmtB family transcription factor [Thermodesulfobacteriota bacterium]
MSKKDSIRKEVFEIQAGVCQCLANPKRLEILHILRDRELSATDIAGKVGISNANASQHLAIMRTKGLLKSRREGVSIRYSLANPKVTTACDIMREVLFEHLDEKRRLTGRVRTP